jgi:ketosteroid isomerase-like protein
MSPLELIRSWIGAIEAGFDLAPFLAEDCVQEEMPNRLFPAGRRNDRAAILANAEKGRGVIERQRYDIVSATVEGERIALEIEWSGTLKVPFGAVPVGAELRAKIAMFLTVRDGQIAQIRNYDCYAEL